jgi:LmbE family N-acetylglucosaminyl deacetylase
MASEGLTMLCVHAHPDDEALFTAGIQAHYKLRGVRQVLITTTLGDLGFDPAGRGFEDRGYDAASVAATRAQELAQSCRILGIDRAVQLGYHDSGMSGWSSNDAGGAFINQAIDEVAARIAVVIDEERPQVLVTYGADGFYGHPDHVATHAAVMAALERTDSVEKLYFVAMAQSVLAGFAELADDEGVLLPEWLGPGMVRGIEDSLIQSSVDCHDVVATKHEALAAHASQQDNSDLLAMSDELFEALFSVESFVRAFDTTSSPLPESDLFAGISA